MFDITDRMVVAYDAGIPQATVAKNDTPFSPSTSPVAAVTFAELAAHRSSEIASKPKGFEDLDESLNFQALVACLANYVDDASEQSPSGSRLARRLRRVGGVSPVWDRFKDLWFATAKNEAEKEQQGQGSNNNGIHLIEQAFSVKAGALPP